MKWFHKLIQKHQSPAVLIFALAAIVAMTISFWIGIQQSVWFDEAYSVLVAQHDIGDIISLTSVDTHPPGYYIMLHGWGNTFGWDAVSLRLLSVLALGVSVVIAGLLVRRMFGDRAAITSVALIAISPLLLRYGFEIRMYAIASLIGVAATYVLVVARANAGRWAWRWVVYGLLVAVGMLTLYHLALLWTAHVVWLVLSDWRKFRRVWALPWVWAYVGAFILFLPWLPKFLGQIGNGALANIGQPMTLDQLLGVITFNMSYKPVWQTGVGTAVLVIAGIIGAVWAWRRVYANPRYRAYLALLALYIGVPIVLFMLASYWRPLYVERYLSHVAIGLIMLVGVLIAGATRTLHRRYQVAAYAVVAVVILTGVYHLARVGNYNFQRLQKPAVAHVAHDIDCTGATVVAADPYIDIELQYYLPPTCDLRFYSPWQSLKGGYAPLNDSPLRLASTKLPQLSNTLYYVYYKEPELHVAPSYKEFATQTYYDLTVVKYEVR